RLRLCASPASLPSLCPAVSILDALQVLQEDAAHFLDGKGMMMHLRVLRRHLQLTVHVLNVGAAVWHDAVTLLAARAGKQFLKRHQPALRGDTDDRVVVDAGRFWPGREDFQRRRAGSQKIKA